MRWELRAFVVAMVVACGGAPKGPATVTVSLQKTWTKTNLQVKPGQRLKITAKGTLRAGEFAFGPEGTEAHPEWARYSLVPEWPHLALIGKVGDDGDPFLVGKDFSGTVVRGGVLYLGVNDLDAENNEGVFEARVEVQ